MFTVNFYASCFAGKGNSIGKKIRRFNWEKAVYQLLFMLASTLSSDPVRATLNSIFLGGIKNKAIHDVLC